MRSSGPRTTREASLHRRLPETVAACLSRAHQALAGRQPSTTPCNAQGSCEWFTPTAVHPAGYAPYVPWTSPNTHPTFERCTFRNNYAAMGAGVFSYEASLTMSDCVIDHCEGESQGGGIYSARVPMHAVCRSSYVLAEFSAP